MIRKETIPGGVRIHAEVEGWQYTGMEGADLRAALAQLDDLVDRTERKFEQAREDYARAKRHRDYIYDAFMDELAES